LNKKPVIGVFGGMGHSATAHFFNLMVKYQQVVLSCVQDEDFYKSVIYNTALTEWDEKGFVNSQNVKIQLLEEIEKLARFPVDIIAIPCNTVHYFFNDMQKSVTVPIVNMVESVAQKVINSGKKKAGILCSRSTRELRLYENNLDSVETIMCDENEQTIVDKAILDIQAGRNKLVTVGNLHRIMGKMGDNGADGIIVGCTELPVYLHNSPYPMFDSSEILVESLFKRIRNGN
jgi:aspartate racemase